jgi:hypothetical protein
MGVVPFITWRAGVVAPYEGKRGNIVVHHMTAAG